MADVRAMLARVQKLEQRTTAPRSLFERAYGSLDLFAESIQKRIDNGQLDSVEMPLVLNAIRKMHSEDSFKSWHRAGIVEYTGRYR